MFLRSSYVLSRFRLDPQIFNFYFGLKLTLTFTENGVLEKKQACLKIPGAWPVCTKFPCIGASWQALRPRIESA